MQNPLHRWINTVRDYELDSQGIVNNACYMNYFEHARHLFMTKNNIDIFTWQQKGYDFVLIRAELIYKWPLTSNNEFCIETKLTRPSKLKIKFNQQLLLLPEKKLCTQMISLATCINNKTRKPVFPPDLEFRLERFPHEQ